MLRQKSARTSDRYQSAMYLRPAEFVVNRDHLGRASSLSLDHVANLLECSHEMWKLEDSRARGPRLTYDLSGNFDERESRVLARQQVTTCCDMFNPRDLA